MFVFGPEVLSKIPPPSGARVGHSRSGVSFIPPDEQLEILRQSMEQCPKTAKRMTREGVRRLKVPISRTFWTDKNGNFCSCQDGVKIYVLRNPVKIMKGYHYQIAPVGSFDMGDHYIVALDGFLFFDFTSWINSQKSEPQIKKPFPSWTLQKTIW